MCVCVCVCVCVGALIDSDGPFWMTQVTRYCGRHASNIVCTSCSVDPF